MDQDMQGQRSLHEWREARALEIIAEGKLRCETIRKFTRELTFDCPEIVKLGASLKADKVCARITRRSAKNAQWVRDNASPPDRPQIPQPNQENERG